MLARKYQESTLHSISKTFRCQTFCEPAVRTERESRRFEPDRLVANLIHGAAKSMKVKKHSDGDPMSYHSTYCSGIKVQLQRHFKERMTRVEPPGRRQTSLEPCLG
jgi:hypothetical protein